jgi:hypothetical protein
LSARQRPAPRLLDRPDALHLVERARQEAQILEQAATRGSRVRRRLGAPLIMGAPRVGVTQQQDGAQGVDQQHSVHGMACVLAAITARLRRRILGTCHAPFGAIVANRGAIGSEGGAAAGRADVVGGPAVGLTIAVAAASATPRRMASASKDRVGASPSARRVACRTMSKT